MRIKSKAGNKYERSFVVWLVISGILLIGSYAVFIRWIGKHPEEIRESTHVPVQKKVVEVMDPVCKMTIKPPAAGHIEYRGKTYYFCGIACKKDFEKDPKKYLNQVAFKH